MVDVGKVAYQATVNNLQGTGFFLGQYFKGARACGYAGLCGFGSRGTSSQDVTEDH